MRLGTATRWTGLAILALLALVSCSRDPNAEKTRLLAHGNLYYGRGQYKQASRLYRLALNKDSLFGPAYYRLALTDLKLADYNAAAGDLQRAAELLPPGSAESDDAKVQLADLYLLATRRKDLLDEVAAIAAGFLSRDPKSFEGHRLNGELLSIAAEQAFSSSRDDEGKKLMASAIGEYRAANTAKPGQVNAMLALAKALAATDQYDEAEKLYWGALKKDKTLTAIYTQLYELYAAENHPADAEAVLQTAMINNPREYRFLALLAGHYRKQGQRGDMVQALEQISSRVKEFPTAFLTTGDFYLRIGEGGEAIHEYERGALSDPEHEPVYQKRIIEVLIRQGKRDKAAAVNAEVLRKNPNDIDARSLKSSLLVDKGGQKSIDELQIVVAGAPKDYVARYNLGRAHAANGEHTEARRRFLEAIQLRADFIPPRLGLAQLLLSRGEHEAALMTAADVLKLDKTNTEAPLIQASALAGLKRYAESEQILQGLIKSHPESADVLFQAGNAYLRINKVKEAEETFWKLNRLEPVNPRGLIAVVDIYVSQHQEEKAIALMQDELRRHPERWDYRTALGATAERIGRYDLAIEEYRKVIQNIDQSSEAAAGVYFHLGQTYRLKGDLGNAIPALEKALVLRPEDPKTLDALAQALYNNGQKQEARQVYEECLRFDAKNATTLNKLASILVETGGDLDQALTYAQRARQLAPQFSEVSDTIGQIYLKKQLTDNAVEILSAVVEKQPARAGYRYHLGMAYAQQGEKNKAIQELLTALKSKPSKEEEGKIRQLLQSWNKP